MLRLSRFVKDKVLKSIPTSANKLEIEIVDISLMAGVTLKIKFMDDKNNELLYATLPPLIKGGICTVLDAFDLSIKLESD